MVVITKRITPVWLRELDLVIENEHDANCAGVYILWIGDMFYVGESRNVRVRLLSHRVCINMMLYEETFLKKSRHNLGSYTNILKYLQENKDVKTIYGHMIQKCKNKKEAKKEESEYLRMLQGHFLGTKCLNKQSYYSIFDEMTLEELLSY